MCRKTLAILCCAGLLAVALPAQEPDQTADGKDLLLRAGFDPGRYTQIEVTQKELRNLDVTVTLVKGTDPVTGESVGGALDPQGRPVDFSELRAQEIALKTSNPEAKLDPELREALATATGPLEVVLWLDFDAESYDRHIASLWSMVDIEAIDKETARAIEGDIARWIIARNAETTGPVVDLLETSGVPVRYVSETAPVIFATAAPHQIMDLAALHEVDTIYLEDDDKMDYNTSARGTHRTERVHNFGVRGRGVRVALLENNGVDPACPYLNVTGWFNAGTPNPDDHIHGTSGCVASQLSTRLGTAPDVELFSANADSYSDNDVTAAGDWVATQNIDITNNSWGPTSPTGNLRYADRYFDYQSRFFQDSYVHSAGNSGIGTSVGNVGWNLISVGSIHDQDNSDWDDDVMSTFSATADPSTGCEKPNVVGVGDAVDTLGDGNTSSGGGCGSNPQTTAWLIDNYCGTSFSSPFTAANMANAFVVDATPVVSPEAAMAMIMATAWHNINGATRLSDEDGAGAINGLAAFRCALDGRITSHSLTSSSFNTSGYFVHNIHLQGGDKTRVCIAWSSNANSSYTTDVLDADLDLAIYTGQNATSGTAHGFSSSFDNNFEIVEFTPPATGWYTVRVNDFRFDGSSERMGIAWSQKTQDTSSFRLREWVGSDTGPTIGTSSYYMDFDAPHSPGDSYLCAPGSNHGPGFSFSPETWSPLSQDIWTTLWFDHISSNNWFWTGSFGSLNSSGNTFGNRMSIPDFPGLVGTELSHVGFTINPNYPDTIKEISDPHTFAFYPHETVLSLGDDDFEEVSLPFTFKFYGQYYDSVYVNSNGNLTFGSGDSDFTESASQFVANEPRIAFLWDDLSPNNATSPDGVQIKILDAGEEALVVEFLDVPAFGTSNANTVRTTLHEDGRITIDFENVAEDDGLVGISPGNGLSGVTTERDLSRYGYGFSGTNDALFEIFSGSGGDNNDLEATTIWYNTVEFIPANNDHTNYRLKLEID